MVVLRRPAVDRPRRLGAHGLHRHRRQGEARPVQRRDGRAPAAHALPRARGRRPQQPQPRLLQEEDVRVRLAARRLRLPAQPRPVHGLPGVQERLGPGREVGGLEDDPARPGLRARLHVPEPGRLGEADVPLHARPVLVPVLHLDEGRQDVEAAAHARARTARGRPQRPALREVRHGAGRLDPDDVLRRAPRLVQEQPLLHALQGRPLLQGRRDAHRHDGRRALPAGPARHGPALLRARRPRLADGHRLGRRRRPAHRLLQPHRGRRRLQVRALQRPHLGQEPGRAGRRQPVRLPQRRHHVRPRRPRLGRPHAADRRRARDRGAPHGRRRSLVGGDAAHAQLEDPQLPPRVPARLRRGRRADRRLRLRRGLELPLLPHRGEDAHRPRADRAGPVAAAFAARPDADAHADAGLPPGGGTPAP